MPGWLKPAGYVYTMPGWAKPVGYVHTMPGWLKPAGYVYTYVHRMPRLAAFARGFGGPP